MIGRYATISQGDIITLFIYIPYQNFYLSDCYLEWSHQESLWFIANETSNAKKIFLEILFRDNQFSSQNSIFNGYILFFLL